MLKTPSYQQKLRQAKRIAVDLIITMGLLAFWFTLYEIYEV